MAWFSGTPGLVVKIALLAVTNGLAIWAAAVLLDNGRYPALVALVLVTVGIDVVYAASGKWAMPLKFVIPGVLLLLAFQLIPIVYTFNVAFTNYSTGHVLS